MSTSLWNGLTFSYLLLGQEFLHLGQALGLVLVRVLGLFDGGLSTGSGGRRDGSGSVVVGHVECVKSI